MLQAILPWPPITGQAQRGGEDCDRQRGGGRASWAGEACEVRTEVCLSIQAAGQVEPEHGVVDETGGL